MRISTFLICLACLIVSNGNAQPDTSKYLNLDTLSLTINKIKEKGDVSILIASDEFNHKFKIYSTKKNERCAKEIRRGRSYRLILKSYFEERKIMVGSIRSVEILGVNIKLDSESNYMLYEAVNLNGRCLYEP